MPQVSRKRRNNPEQVLTIFIHGFKGSEYDLSKIKSYLNIFFGYSHFYSIKGLNSSEISKFTIKRLAETAADEILYHLSQFTGFKHINIIAFSLGGVIARAMLPRLKDHKHKFNLLITVASPHLGIRDL